MDATYAVGQALWSKIRFPDGEFPEYKRPYLIVGVGSDYLEILTVSSVAGKEWKLTLPTNKEITNYNPPFPRRTFVKLDSFQRVNISDLLDTELGMNGQRLDNTELSEIIDSIIK